MSEVSFFMITCFSTSLDLCAAHTPKFLNTCMKIWSETNKQEVQDGVATKLKDVITLCVAPLCVDTQNLNTGRSKSVILEVIKILSSGLNFIYNAVWRQVFNLIAILFQVTFAVKKHCIFSDFDLCQLKFVILQFTNIC